MDRISRVSAAMSGVKCPGCGKHVVPTLKGDEAPTELARSEPAGSTPGRRWSFVWRPPSGRVCPACRFPMERYARRLKWIRIFRMSVAVLAAGVVLLMLDRFAELPAWLRTVYRVFGAVGMVGFAVGGIGMIVGGQSSDAA